MDTGNQGPVGLFIARGEGISKRRSSEDELDRGGAKPAAALAVQRRPTIMARGMLPNGMACAGGASEGAKWWQEVLARDAW